MGEIRFVGTGETRGYLYLVCKKLISDTVGGSYLQLKSVKTNKFDEVMSPAIEKKEGMHNPNIYTEKKNVRVVANIT